MKKERKEDYKYKVALSPLTESNRRLIHSIGVGCSCCMTQTNATPIISGATRAKKKDDEVVIFSLSSRRLSCLRVVKPQNASRLHLFRAGPERNLSSSRTASAQTPPVSNGLERI